MSQTAPTWALRSAVALLAVLMFGGVTASAQEPPPNSMAALGDSITRGFDACTVPGPCLPRSWSTGTSAEVMSHYVRILAVNPGIRDRAINAAETGAQMVDLDAQVRSVIGTGVEYVTILMGANDVCQSSEAEMTSVDLFASQGARALRTLKAGLPAARLFISGIPDPYRLWTVGKGSLSARLAWSTGNICQSMLANPLSTSQEDEARRQRVRQRTQDYNAVLASGCARYGPMCKFDGGAVFAYPFELWHLSRWDYFHPNAAGQQVLAAITYRAGFNW